MAQAMQKTRRMSPLKWFRPLALLTALTLGACITAEDQTPGDCQGGKCDGPSDEAAGTTCSVPKTVVMQNYQGSFQQAQLAYRLDTGECEFEGGSLQGVDPDDDNILFLHFVQVIEEDFGDYGAGDINYSEGWKAVHTSQGLAQCVTHNVCEFVPGKDIFVLLETDAEERDDGLSFVVWLTINYAADMQSFTIKQFEVREGL